MLEGEDTGVAQKAGSAFKSLIQMTEAMWSAGGDGNALTQQVE